MIPKSYNSHFELIVLGYHFTKKTVSNKFCDIAIRGIVIISEIKSQL